MWERTELLPGDLGKSCTKPFSGRDFLSPGGQAEERAEGKSLLAVVGTPALALT